MPSKRALWKLRAPVLGCSPQKPPLLDRRRNRPPDLSGPAVGSGGGRGAVVFGGNNRERVRGVSTGPFYWAFLLVLIMYVMLTNWSFDWLSHAEIIRSASLVPPERQSRRPI